MASENIGPFFDPENQGKQGDINRQSFAFPPIEDAEKTLIAKRTRAENGKVPQTPSLTNNNQLQEPMYREHVSRALPPLPSEAPGFRPAYNPYQAGQPAPAGQGPNNQYPVPPAPYPGYQPTGPAMPGYNGYPPAYPYPGYYGYSPYPYPYPWQPPKPKRDGYLFGISIASFISAILITLGGFVCALILLLLLVLPNTRMLPADQRFAAMAQLLAFALAGIVGGGFTLYHSIRSLFLRKPSAQFKLPWFWIFFVLYLGVIAIGASLLNQGQSIANTPLTLFLIALAGILPAVTILALGVRRIHFPRLAPWPTTWRRLTVSLVGGATLAIVLALIFETLLAVLLAREFGVKNLMLDNPDQPIPQDPRGILFMFILLSVIAPLVEEAVKPLAAVIMIRRINSAAEAFVLGMAGGIGFNLIETFGYISMGYKDWLTVAIERSAAGLLHGFGAAMIALGWYYLTHRDSAKNRFLLVFACWAYAILQHALWNGSFGLQLLPAPVGPYLDHGVVTLGPVTFESFILVYLVESILMLAFFLYVTKKLRGQAPPAPRSTLGQPGPQPVPQSWEKARAYIQ
ncbi:PrsW family intramembrane metalloprotease [Ktedonosporobacter rubrisoli]|uniref:PrsW family intramembrane metalloprotease n=1 Tax=Ktedonosporobacter rubrisoli TaxID=2509675 RepID=A0A4V0YZK1_KTERU|nr:PrsW family glutamic-type intramembrane protease [Ktedonosporobacter rubrisoli]QBD80001.1 PrsW family intramembrane metalloprotease [Ktedonosporobacter rubrisoli]